MTHLLTASKGGKIEIIKARYYALIEDNLLGLVAAGIPERSLTVLVSKNGLSTTFMVNYVPMLTIKVDIRDNCVLFHEVAHRYPIDN